MTQTKTQQIGPQIFTVWSDEIEGRIDPHFYIFQTQKFLNLTPINKFAKIQGGYAFKSSEYKNEDGIPLVRIQNIKDSEIDLSDTVYIDKKYLKSCQRFLLKGKDILIAMTGATIGKVGRIYQRDLPAFLNQRVGRFIINSRKINSDYLFYILQFDFFTEQIKRLSLGGSQPNISPTSIEEIKIPLPPLSSQNKIVGIMQKAYQEKKEKETKANKLLESIDDYVLKELGIKMPEIKREMVFEVMSDKVENNRMDPLYYSQKDIYSFLKEIKCKVKSIGEITKYLQTGFAAGAKDQKDGGIIQIRPTNINNYGHLKFEKNIFVKRECLEKRKNDILQKGEVLFNNTNSQELVGKTSFFDLDGNYFCSNHITRIATNKKLDPEFLKLILNIYQKIGIFYNICTNWNNQSGVNIELLRTINIPVPPLVIQNRIVEKIKFYYSQAKKLKDEANNNLQKAKEKVEQIILG